MMMMNASENTTNHQLSFPNNQYGHDGKHGSNKLTTVMFNRYEALNSVIDSTVVPCIGGLIVVFNIIVIYYMIRYRRRQHNPIAIVYMFNMVIGDLFVGVVIIVLKIADMVLTKENVQLSMPDYMFFRSSVLRLALFISVLNLIPLTLDRVWAVKWPISHRQNKRKTAVRICLAVWTLSFAFVLFLYLFYYFKELDRSGIKNLLFPLATYPTTLIFIACYIVIFKELRSSRKYRQRTGSRSVSTMMAIAGRLSIDSRSSSIISISKIDEKKGEVRFVQLAIKTVVIFIICWFPISTCGLVTCPSNIKSFFLILGYLNAAVTPLVYYTHMRQALGRKIRRLTCRRQTPTAATLALSKSVCAVIGGMKNESNRMNQPPSSSATSPVATRTASIAIAGVENNKIVIGRSD